MKAFERLKPRQQCTVLKTYTTSVLSCMHLPAERAQPLLIQSAHVNSMHAKPNEVVREAYEIKLNLRNEQAGQHKQSAHTQWMLVTLKR